MATDPSIQVQFTVKQDEFRLGQIQQRLINDPAFLAAVDRTQAKIAEELIFEIIGEFQKNHPPMQLFSDTSRISDPEIRELVESTYPDLRVGEVFVLADLAQMLVPDNYFAGSAPPAEIPDPDAIYYWYSLRANEVYRAKGVPEGQKPFWELIPEEEYVPRFVVNFETGEAVGLITRASEKWQEFIKSAQQLAFEERARLFKEEPPVSFSDFLAELD